MQPAVIELISQGMYLILLLSLPPILVASVIGVLLSLIQAITQLQEQTLSFGIKLIAVSITLFLSGSWISGQLLEFSKAIFDRFYLLQ
ncbi:MAG: type III secretion system export apparatus subunit SctS [Succinatimonas sp.]|nr:type III secretion system export apparatus subunit SctS [Succinatimonas sp.]